MISGWNGISFISVATASATQRYKDISLPLPLLQTSEIICSPNLLDAESLSTHLLKRLCIYMTYEYLNDTHMTYIYVSTYRGGAYWQYIVFFSRSK